MVGSLIGGLIGGALGGAIWGGIWIAADKDIIWLVLLVGLFSGIGAKLFTPANKRGVISGTIAAAITLIAAVGTPFVVAKVLINQERQSQAAPVELTAVTEGDGEETEGEEEVTSEEPVDIVITHGGALPATDVSVLKTRVPQPTDSMDLVLYAVSGVLAYVVAGSGAAKKSAAFESASSDAPPATDPAQAPDAPQPPDGSGSS